MALAKEVLRIEGYKKVVYAEDRERGLAAIVAIHNTNRGPACGGIRMLPYANRDEALKDVLRLSKGMSYKSALANIGFGGGKSVIIGDPGSKRPETFQAFGEFVESFQGEYIAAKDMNTEAADLLQVKTRTPHVLGIEGEPGSSGDPSPVTARGVYRAIEATVEFVNGSKSLRGASIALQGLGYVGWRLAEMLHEAGSKLWVSDVNTTAVERAVALLGAVPVSRDRIYECEVDVFSPCAVGAVLNQDTIERLRCKAIVGCANNQLATERDGARLYERGILYAPDYAVNSGGIINVFQEYEGYDEGKALQKADLIYSTMREIFQRSAKDHVAPFLIADKLAEERLYGA